MVVLVMILFTYHAGSNALETQGQTIIGGEGNDTLSFENINNGVLLDFVFGIGTFDEVRC